MKISKIVKLRLICDQTDKDGNPVDYKTVCKILFDLQRQTRELKNKTIQLCWEWHQFSSDYYKKHEIYPKDKEILDYTLSGYIDSKLKLDNDLYSGNCSTTIRMACKEFNNAKLEILKGQKSMISYKQNQPLEIHNKAISLEYSENHEWFVSLALLKTAAFQKHHFANSKIRFKVIVKDNSTKTILERCFDKLYHIAASELIYSQKNKAWFLNLTYSFEASNETRLDAEKILGIDLGVACPVCASVYGSKERLKIASDEIEAFRRKTEQRKIALLRQGKYCGDGRIGHGRKKRVQPVDNIGNAIARFRDTVNHKYSRAVVDFAVKMNCGVIQMENLTSITENANRFLKNWTYYDLQTKIKNKAQEAGIKVILINPKYTSQRCSKCGYIDSENRKTQAQFICLKCGFTENADYNASQNIALKDIEKIIQQTKSESANDK